MRFECAARTHVGLRRKINEDSLLVDSTLALWAVADGMGGHQAGEVASAMVTDALRCLLGAENIGELTSRAVDVLHEVNGQLRELARSDQGERETTIGTTIVGLVMDDRSFRCFWMGDSRAYQVRGDQITRLTHDHSVVQNLVDAGLLKPEEAETHESANLITRAVGASDAVDVDLVTGDVCAGDLFLLASDGLTRVVRDNELLAELRQHSLQRAADKLIDMVLARGAPDNVSLVVIEVRAPD